MIISHDNKPKFKLQTAYDTLTSRLRGLGYDVDGNIELDTSGYGHGWIKVLRNGRKNNFIYMCSHSDNVDPLCCEPVYRYIKVYNYCDDPKDSNLLGEIPMVVSNIESIPNTTEVYKDDEYKVYKDNATNIVWGYMNLGDGHVAQAPWTSYPTTLKDISGGNVDFSVPYFDIVDNKGIKLEDGSYSAFDDLFKDEDVLYVGKSKEKKKLYTWNSYISGAVYSESLNSSIDNTICTYCLGTGKINDTQTGSSTHCTHCNTDKLNVSEIVFQGTDGEKYVPIPLVPAQYDEIKYEYDHEAEGAPFLFNGSIFSVEEIPVYGTFPRTSINYGICAEKIKDKEYKITYCLHKLAEISKQGTTYGGETFTYRNNRIAKREFITTLSETEYTKVRDTFTYKNLSNITVEINLPPIKDLVEGTELHGWNTNHTSLSVYNTITRTYLHAYMKDHKDPNGVYENINVHVNDNNSKLAEILNYVLHSKTKTFEYSPKYTWNYDEIMNFILYKDENLQVLPTRNGIYHLKTNYYNELNNLSDIGNLENVLDGNTCMHVGYLGDNQMHSAYNVNLNNKDNDISYLQAYPYIKDPYNSRYNYFPNEETQNMLYWNTPKNGFFEGVFQFHNDVIDAIPNKYVWLTLNESAYDVYNNSTRNCDPIQYEPYYSYEGKIDTAEIRKPNTDKEWQWRNNFHNFMTNREVKTIYYKESFSAHDTLSAGSGMTYLANGQENSNVSQNFIFTDRPAIANDYFNEGADMKIHNNISWNGLSAYRHICRTCSGVGMINPYKHGCNNWANYPYKGQSPFYELQKNDLLCPTCGRTGINIRYLYYKHKYIKPLSMYGLQLDDVADPRISNKNQLLLPTNLMDEDIKKDLILYTTSAEPIGYSACTVYGSKLTYKKAYLGYGQMWNYVDVPRDANNNFQFITDFHQIYPKWDRLSETEQNKIRKQHQNQLYRGIELPDNFVQYYVFRGQDKNVAGGPKDAWSRIFFDPKWIEKQYFENNTVENPCQYNLKEEIINKGEHNHNHVSQEKYTLNMNNRYYPYYGEVGHHDRDLELDYRKTGVKLQHTCKMCNGEGEIDVYKVNSNGEIIYDIMNNPIIIKDTCPVCNGNGYLEDTYREDYNIEHCDNCDDTGHVVCPTCLGLGTTYKAKQGYTYEETYSSPNSSMDDRKNRIVGYLQTNNNKKTILFFTFTLTTIPHGGSVWIPVQHGDPIVYGEEPPADLAEIIELKPCPNCSRYTDLAVGQIPCPECGGVFKYKNPIHGDTEEKYYRIAPGNEDNKKLYKYISINAVSIDNISVEMDNG